MRKVDKMKILLVLDQFDGANNGNTITAWRLADTLKKHGHEVRIAAVGEDREDKYGFPVFSLPIFDKLVRSQGFLFARPQRDKLSAAVDWADIVHVMMPFAIEKMAVKLALEKGKPVTGAFHVQPENIWFSVHLGNCMPLINFTYFVAREYLFKYLNFIHCPSRMIRDQLVRHKYKADLRVISNGIQPDFVYHKSPKRPEFQDKFLIVMSGRHSREKKQDVLIDAVNKSKYRDRIQLFLAGQGPLTEQYRKQGSKLPNRPILKFLTKAELIQLFGETDLYVHASEAEIEAMSCMEAFASGLVPIIANSKRSATPQFALDERSLFKPGDSTDLAAHIDWWIEHEEERKRMEFKYAESAENYRLDDCVRKMEKMFYDEIDFNKNQSVLEMK